ncbi:MAG: hypothetical protein A3K19_29020 [Lentisphaerae bacterium RIFOXYB12_FULL_65_16]|nr:MAG: hypothetical protein A3K18_25605 [Lentisphaerae bacterium RIFOXYA12_64_32]OGV88333.1 MAG: hypothetical protein A3K19_29020 [Lentisphaerae bacterium RIFOXYB12_FULL_65_16]
MTTTFHNGTAHGLWSEFQALTKPQRDKFLASLLRVAEYREDLLDIACMEARRGEPSRPLREYMAERATRERR